MSIPEPVNDGFRAAWDRARSAVLHIAEVRVPEILCILGGIVAIYYGATSAVEADKINGAQIFDPAIDFAYLHLWVGAWIGLGVGVILFGIIRRYVAIWINLGLALVWSWWAVKLAESQAAGAGLLNAPGTYSGLALYAAFAALTCVIPPPPRKKRR